MKVSTKVFSEDEMKALWCAIDVNDSNDIQKEEMAMFFKRGMHGSSTAQVQPAASHASAHDRLATGGISNRFGMAEGVASTPTIEIRGELRAAGVDLPDDSQLNDLSCCLNGWLDEYRHRERKPKAHSWFNLFCEIDEDRSGFITFDELREAIRLKLHVGPSMLAESSLKAMWCAIDTDNSNAIHKDEMATFFKRGAHGSASAPLLPTLKAPPRQRSSAPELVPIELQELTDPERLKSLIDSPRFKTACSLYGIDDAETLLPQKIRSRSNADQGLEATLYKRRETRRLIDLGNVLVERQRLIADHAATVPHTTEPHAKPAADTLDGVQQTTQQWISIEKRRTRNELLALVKEETAETVLHKQKVMQQAQAEADAAKNRIADDAKRRARNRDFHAGRDARLAKIENAKQQQEQARREAQQQQMTRIAAQRAAQAELLAQEFKRRKDLEMAHAHEVQERSAAQHEAMRSEFESRRDRAAIHYANRRKQLDERMTAKGAPKGKVLSIDQTPMGRKIAIVRGRVVAEQERSAKQLQHKLEEDRKRLQANDELRKAANVMRREWSTSRTRHHKETFSRLQETNELYRQSIQQKVENASKSVDDLHERERRQIEDKRQLSLARDAEKARCAERVSRAREYAKLQVMEKQQATNQRVGVLRDQRSELTLACLNRVRKIHHAREHLKESLLRSATPSLRTLRKESGLLTSLGVDLKELEQASDTLTTSLSAPMLARPTTAPTR